MIAEYTYTGRDTKIDSGGLCRKTVRGVRRHERNEQIGYLHKTPTVTTRRYGAMVACTRGHLIYSDQELGSPSHPSVMVTPTTD